MLLLLLPSLPLSLIPRHFDPPRTRRGGGGVGGADADVVGYRFAKMGEDTDGLGEFRSSIRQPPADMMEAGRGRGGSSHV